MGVTVNLSDVRAHWIWLQKMKTIENEGKPDTHRFECTLIVDPDSDADKRIEQGMLDAAVEKWGEKGETILNVLKGKGRVTYKDGNTCVDKEGTLRDGFADTKYFTPYRNEGKGRVMVFNEFGEKADDTNWSSFPTEGEGHLPRNGDYVQAQVNFWAQDNPSGGQRINAELVIVKMLRDGPPLGGGVDVSDETGDAFLAEMGVSEKSAQEAGLRG